MAATTREGETKVVAAAAREEETKVVAAAAREVKCFQLHHFAPLPYSLTFLFQQKGLTRA